MFPFEILLGAVLITIATVCCFRASARQQQLISKDIIIGPDRIYVKNAR